MLAQALEANGAIVYILGRRQEMLEKAAATAVRSILCHVKIGTLITQIEKWQHLRYQGRRYLKNGSRSGCRAR
jgi:hypothetical protein